MAEGKTGKQEKGQTELAPKPSFQVGIDIMLVASVEASLRRFGDRYRHRLFSDRELADAAGPGEARGLAARFAAKEAAIKALGPEDEPLPWRSIEVEKSLGGRPVLCLHGEASALASRRDLDHWAVSLSHEGPMAAAVVIAERRAGREGDGTWTI